MTLSLYIQLVAARAHAERLRAENPPPQPSEKQRLALQALKAAGRPMSTKQVAAAAGMAQRRTLTALYELQERGLVDMEQRRVSSIVTNYWTLLDDAE